RPARGGPEWAIWPVLSERLNPPRHGDVGTDVRVLPRLAHGLEAGPPVELDGRQSGVAPQQATAVTPDMSEHGIETKRADALASAASRGGHATHAPRGRRRPLPRRRFGEDDGRGDHRPVVIDGSE